MQVQNQVNNSDKWFLDEMMKLLDRLHRQKLSEAVKRGIQAKKLQKGL